MPKMTPENAFYAAAGWYCLAVQRMKANRDAFRALKKLHDDGITCIAGYHHDRDASGVCDACAAHEDRFNHKKLIAELASRKRSMMNRYRKLEQLGSDADPEVQTCRK